MQNLKLFDAIFKTKSQKKLECEEKEKWTCIQKATSNFETISDAVIGSDKSTIRVGSDEKSK